MGESCKMKSLAVCLPVLLLLGSGRAECPDDSWHRLDNMCYRVAEFVAAFQWDAADAICDCIQPGATLVSIHNTVTNALLADLISEMNWETAWIGLRRSASNHTWYWQDQSDVDWMDEHPDVGSGDCMSLGTDEHWHTVECTSTEGRTTACQYPAE